MDCELLILNLLIKGLFINDDLVSVDQMFFKLVRNDSFQWTYLVRITYRLNSLSYLVVGVSWLNESQCCLDGFVGSEDNLGFFTCDGCRFIGLNYDCVANK